METIDTVNQPAEDTWNVERPEDVRRNFVLGKYAALAEIDLGL